MSAQLVLTDREMDVILKCVRSIAAQTYPPARLDPDEVSAALTICGKLVPHAERRSRRQPKSPKRIGQALNAGVWNDALPRDTAGQVTHGENCVYWRNGGHGCTCGLLENV